MRKRYRQRGLPAGYAAGAAAARTGDEMSGPALLLAGPAITGSAASGSALLAGITAATALGGPLLGALLDRSPAPGRLLAAALAGHALALTAVLVSLGRIPLGWTLLIAVAVGLLAPALAGGWSAQLPAVTPARELPRATALDAMTFNAAALAGPALAGATAQLAGAHTAVAVAAVLISLALPAALRLPRRSERPGAEPVRGAGAPRWSRPAAWLRTGLRTDPVAGLSAGSAAGLRADPVPGLRTDPAAGLRAGLRTDPAAGLRAQLAAGPRAIVRNGPLARATAATTVSCAGEGLFVVCAPALGERDLGGPGHGALLLAAVAAAALAAGALFARAPVRPRPEAVIAGSAVLSAAAMALAAPGGPVLLAVAVVLAGLGQGPQLAAVFAIRHREAPERLRGQIFTTGASLKLTGFAVGAGIGGPLVLQSPPGALLAAAAVQLLAALCCAARRRGRPARIGPARSAADVPTTRSGPPPAGW
ncbi:MFS transporter [Streptomyces sp. NPDC020141]|uniref:MFS transporter n=1 Tax=Streptomyces sp. NPDC020141 TaxID=3365065 RepID=UPI00378D37C2